jgi:spermidine synthase
MLLIDSDEPMDAAELVDTAEIPGNGGELQLFKCDEEYSISIKGAGVLMSTWAHQSEDALAELACRKISDRERPRVLIGGLGMGFTLAAALRHLGPDAEVVVAELVPGVVAWNEGLLGKYADHPLQDERTIIREGDVAKRLRSERQAYDAIMLDVDNGPNGLTRKKNDWLYSTDGLTEAYNALKPGGILAIWSAATSRNFMERLRKVGFKVKQSRVPEQDNKGDLHAIWIAERVI